MKLGAPLVNRAGRASALDGPRHWGGEWRFAIWLAPDWLRSVVGRPPRAVYRRRAMSNPELIDATGLESLSTRLKAKGLLPHIVRRLLAATPGVTGLVVPAEEGVAAPGFDAVLDGGPGSPWVPGGPSVWEMGTNYDKKAKADEDYTKRTKSMKAADRKKLAFVFVTSRRWAAGKNNWAKTRAKERKWRKVVVLDAEELHAWLEATPDVHVWLSEQLGLKPLSVRTLERAFEQLAARTRPPLPLALLLAGREAQRQALISSLAADPSVVVVRAGSREEALAFVGAALAPLTVEGALAPLVVRDAVAVERLTLSDRPLTLVVTDVEAEVGDAAAHGHRVMLPLGAGDFGTANAIELPRPDRSAAHAALREAGVSFADADRLAGLARRGFAALLREMAVTPGGARPAWAAGDNAPLLAALLLVGGWSSLPGDGEVVAAVTGRDLTAIEQRLLALSGSEDAPWARSGGAWRLVSPEDSWVVLNEFLTEQMLAVWQAEALDVLSDIDSRLELDSGERLLADIRGELTPTYSAAVKEGTAQAAALLGGRGENATRSGLRPARYAEVLVTRLLGGANEDPTGAVWRSLAPVLPWLAEAAPDPFLDAVVEGLSSDPSPVLTMFTDGPGYNVLFSHSPHTELLWALEAVAWSAERLTRVVLLLGELAAREAGGRLVNRPPRSLRAILLDWCPQTAAGPEARLAALDGLRERWPDVAWALELALLPASVSSTSACTHRPRFRDWGLDDVDVSPQARLVQLTGVAARLGYDASARPERWAELVGRISALPAELRDGLLARLTEEVARTQWATRRGWQSGAR